MNSQIIIVTAYIRNEAGDVLLAKRNQKDIPEIHGMWEFVGGGIEFGEDPIDAIIREVREEIAVEVKDAKLMPKIITNTQLQNDGTKKQFFILTYECKILSGIPIPNDPEIAEVKFVPINEIKNYRAFKNVLQTTELFK
jgi:mutator protein MutT